MAFQCASLDGFDGRRQEADDKSCRREREERMKEGCSQRQTGAGADMAGRAKTRRAIEEMKPERGGEVEHRKPTQK